VTPRRAPAARHRNLVPALCLAVFLVVWSALAMAPRFRADWLLENLPTFLAVPFVVWSWRRCRFSDRAYAQGTLFAILHTIGSHYTYSEVPLGAWLRDAFGLGRNHYDRFVHFAFGFLMLRPAYELGCGRDRHRRPVRIGRLYCSVAGIVFWSALYEIGEWLVARIVDPAAGTAFLGTQGDPWDVQKDMACALVGALLAAVFEAAIDRAARPFQQS
jgi:putative membrane protein